jgi:hypothetical protein
MKCERCSVATKGYELHDYCVWCSKNLCEKCMHKTTCSDSVSGHEASASVTCKRCGSTICDCDYKLMKESE